ncbi:tetratricopeptide repeat protein [Alkalimarinus alittae]|uniref:Lipoprotein n=1 Tax=Alkalimarinus alittae TaxID=2961619 RepID=A0ABY6N5P2_9ALTE|nr:hypothetical protein [Alkalimarinus alittae]UZE97411.1 hypothetical protein NKI27_06585 [Alkalimarinus alittae]
MMTGKVAVVLLSLCVLQGCGVGWGLSAVSYGALQVSVAAEDVRERAEATNAMEPELIATSVDAISHNKVLDAERAYLHIYEDTSYPDNVRAQALYQNGLMYSVPTHKYYSTERAMMYFEKVMEEFPKSDENLEVSMRIAELQDPSKKKKYYEPNKMLLIPNTPPSK